MATTAQGGTFMAVPQEPSEMHVRRGGCRGAWRKDVALEGDGELAAWGCWTEIAHRMEAQPGCKRLGVVTRYPLRSVKKTSWDCDMGE